MTRLFNFQREGNVNIVLIGAQGSGKGTQAEKLSSVLGMCHVSSGDLFRKAFKDKTDLGMKAKFYVDRGELVPDELTVAMMLEYMEALHNAEGFLLDGFPRTLSQAEALDHGLARVGQQIDLAIHLEVPREVLLRRLSGRYICQAHQHVYNISSRPPKVHGICDIDGSELYQRSDDTGHAVQQRLTIFFNETIRLLDYYSDQYKLVTVNGNQSIEQVRADMLYAVDTSMVPAWQIASFSKTVPSKLTAS
jgi:adenylate kinase